MKKCLIWGAGKTFFDYVNLIKYHEMKGSFQVVGVTTNISAFSEYEGYSYVPKEVLGSLKYDFIVVMAQGKVLRSIYSEISDRGISHEKVFTYKSLMHTSFSPDSFNHLKINPPTIFSNNCWGGMTYNNLGLGFSSPLINLAIEDEDYLRFLERPEHYVKQELKQIDKGYEVIHEFEYPICRCDNIIIKFIHYHNMENVITDWQRRVKRINWNNIFVEMYTQDDVVANKFALLKYEKKVCFVPFESDIDCLCYVPFIEEESMRNISFNNIVLGMAQGIYPYYDAKELLLTGQIKKKER